MIKRTKHIHIFCLESWLVWLIILNNADSKEESIVDMFSKDEVLEVAVDLFLFIPDLQNVNITLRILFRPIAESLPNIFKNLGVDYDERVLPSVVNEVLKAVVVSYPWRQVPNVLK